MMSAQCRVCSLTQLRACQYFSLSINLAQSIEHICRAAFTGLSFILNVSMPQ
jgi:hypothetical protein